MSGGWRASPEGCCLAHPLGRTGHVMTLVGNRAVCIVRGAGGSSIPLFLGTELIVVKLEEAICVGLEFSAASRNGGGDGRVSGRSLVGRRLAKPKEITGGSKSFGLIDKGLEFILPMFPQVWGKVVVRRRAL